LLKASFFLIFIGDPRSASGPGIAFSGHEYVIKKSFFKKIFGFVCIGFQMMFGGEDIF